MGKASKDKGKVGEREVANMLKEIGFDAHRTAQYCGKTGEADDVTGVDGLHIEVKRCETTSIPKWMRQAQSDSNGTGKIPIVVHRRSREPWFVTIEANEFFRIYKAFLEREGEHERD